jgi:mono/diheme cytochrome c family protein
MLVLTGLNEKLSLGAEEERQEQTGFVLPEKHETRLTRKEQRGKVLYEYYCALCHGNSGEADGFNSFTLSKAPKKHSDASFMATISDAYIRQIIKEGGASQELSPLMPPWSKVLSDKDISDLVLFIRTLAQP